MKTLLAIAFVVLFAFPVRAALYDYEKFTLPNGLQVILYSTDGAPAVAQMLFYDAGRMDEEEGRSGVAHFLEHLMFKGKNADFSQKVSRMGGENNAMTSQDYTAYYQIVAAEKLDQVMAMESRRMQNLSFSDEEFETERSVVNQERIQRLEGTPKTRLWERLRQSLWHGHPYAVPVIGYKGEFQRVTKEDVRDFYGRYYTPNNAVLVLAGGFDREKARELVEKHYGQHARKPVKKRSHVRPVRSDIRIRETDPEARQDVMQFLFTAESVGRQMFREEPSYRDVYALMVAAEALGGGNTSRLYRKLVREHGLAVDVAAGYNAFTREEGSFFISVVPAPGADKERIIGIVEEELLRMAKKGMDDKELNLVRDIFMADIIYQKEDIFSIANTLGLSALFNYDPNSLEDGIKGVNSSDIKRAVERMLTDSSRAIAVQEGGAP